MSMNYVGSVSIIDRGDAPAKAVIDKNTRSLAQRVADETKDELNKVMDRVDNIYVSYEMSTQTMFENPRGSPSVEYVEDIKELEEIIKDTVKKKKYQQQVTIFIVGFQDVSAQKMQLLQQVNQFFLENAKPEEEEVEEKMDIDLEEASNKVNESLSTAEELAKKLSDLNQDIIEWLVNYANTKASNKNPNAMVNYDKILAGKKRLEKNLEAAKNDMNNLSEKLLNLQTELEEKDDKMQQLVKQLEVKTQEAVRYKTAAEVAKKSAQDNENHTSTLQDEITRRDEKIQELRTKLSRLEINLTESQFDNQMSMRKLDNSTSQTKQLEANCREKLAKLQEEVNQKKVLVTEAEREMDKLQKEQLHEVKKIHFEEIEELKREHKEELSQLTELVDSVQRRLAQSERDAQQAFDESDEMRSKLLEMQLRDDPVTKPATLKQQQQQQPNIAPRPASGKSIAELSTGDEDQTRPESRPSTKETKSSKKSDSKPVKSTARSPSRVTQGKTVGRKDYADASIQDEGGDANRATVEKSNEPSRQATRQSKTLEPVVETGDRQEFSNSFDLDDEDAWASVPPSQVIGRFAQYRQLGLIKIKELEDQLNITLTKTHRKVNSLKAQFNDHKGKWEAERKILIEQVEQAQKLQTDAEKEADAAMTQLEEFINEQEKLEDEEEVKRQEVLKTMSRPSTTAKKPAPTIAEQKPEAASQDEKPKAEEAEGERIQSDTSEQELKKLMQQTDDAKALEKNSRQSGAISAPPAVEPGDGQQVKNSHRVFSVRDTTDPSRPKSPFDQTPKSAPSNNFPSAKPARKLSISSDAQKPSTPSAQSESIIDVPTSPQPVVPTTPQTIVAMSPQPSVQPVSLSAMSQPSVHPVAVSPLTAPTPGTAVSDIPRPPSPSSVQAIPIPSPIPITSPIQTTHKGTQTDLDMPTIDKEPIQGSTEEEIRESSAKSRASLRSQFKSRLDETRQAVEERRTKSPVISIPSQKSLDDELLIEDDDDDLPIPDDQKAGEVFMKEETFEAGTSPPPGSKLEKQLSFASRHSVNLGEHPVVKEYLRAYTGIHNFKDAISRILEDKDQMSASQILADLDNILFNKDEKVIPQIENMTENIYYVLNEVSQVVNSVLQNDRGPVVSSLMMGMSRDPTQRTIIREKSGVTTDQLFTRASQRSQASKLDSASTERQQYRDLQEQYEKLQNRMSEDARKFDDQQKHNVVVMMEMQDTINQLQRELSNLGKQPRRPASENMSTAGGSQATESAVMFTRLDSERNAKIMKKAVNEKKLDANRYKEAIVQMDDYVNLPGQRLAHLVRKYVHHCRMKEIEENVQNSNSLNENVFEVLDKMEALQNQRAKRWADKMDEMGVERMKLANILMETFDDIERESGIFLIKPMYSYRGREVKERYSGKISRPFRPQRALSPLRDVNSAYAPAPTPASNMRPVRMHQAKEAAMLGQPQDQIQVSRTEGSKPLEGDNVGLMGSSVRYIGTQPKATWSMADSQMRVDPGPQGAGMQGNTPRILELDINRMMIGQNTISASIPGLSNDRLVNASNSNLRSYMTVNRPTGPSSAGKSDRPLSGSRHLDSPGPPPSPTNRSSSTTKRVRMSDIEVPSVMSTAQPLPPIGRSPTPGSTAGSSKGRQSPTRIPVGENSPSPPGSRDSLRHSPVGMSETEISSPIK